MSKGNNDTSQSPFSNQSAYQSIHSVHKSFEKIYGFFSQIAAFEAFISALFYFIKHQTKVPDDQSDYTGKISKGNVT